MGYVRSGAAWQPSSQVGMLGGTLPLLTQSVQFRFHDDGFAALGSASTTSTSIR